MFVSLRHVTSFFLCDSRDVLLEEVDADGLLVVLGEDALAVALYHARLAHRPVPHYHNLQRERWNWMMIGKGGRE